ncbi:hypothetical protein NUU61_003525 [Penicillium alfredii]|uniref:Uncharacterized protein n=1 Tax=Penicillium alfredii TaxID=1506179 RepID=A0A9W9FJD2_9EURO|nr:uncharacterized protein NUU61_003525 [Penicillium alfredii]KAJ5101303.1 hypothetical protein NUU61_003525 [Penicillium alfredii]
MNNTNTDPLFIAQEAVCYYPISTIYNSCPRYLFYALLLASCVTRWTGWLANVFLGAAATYAGTAAFQAFILVASPAKMEAPGPVTIPYLSSNTSLWHNFPELITETTRLMVQPGALELDSDAVLAIVVTGYLVFLPLQCWSRILTHDRARNILRNILFSLWNILMLAGSICALVYGSYNTKVPTQYMFCYPDLPPLDEISSDGWQASWRISTWNDSVWQTFSNITLWGQIGDICYSPCFNSSQILRQPTSLHMRVATRGSEIAHSHKFWDRVLYSKRYIYSLIILCVILNCLLLTFRFLPYRSRIPSAQIMVIWKERKKIWRSFKEEIHSALVDSQRSQSRKSEGDCSSSKHAAWRKIRQILSLRFLKASLHVLGDVAILFGLLFSMIISPFTIIAFVAWVEWCIYNDGPSQEHPQQVGQWSYLVSIGLLLTSAAILTLRYRLASSAELDQNILQLSQQLADLERRRDVQAGTETITIIESRDDAAET